jgi:autotransporter passenger strand-loop-strand repeat protein
MAQTAVGDGQVLSGAVLNDRDTQVLQSESFNAEIGGRASDTTINGGGAQFVMYGSSTNATVNVCGNQYIDGTGTSFGTVLNGGSQIVLGSYDRYGADRPTRTTRMEKPSGR